MAKKTIELHVAEQLAQRLTEVLGPKCTKIMIAGSIRRRRETVGDIEVVCMSEPVVQGNLWGEGESSGLTRLDELFQNPMTLGLEGWRIGAKNGPKAKQLNQVKYDITADVFVVHDERAWGSNVVVRTGPWFFARSLMKHARRTGRRFSDGFLLHDHAQKCGAGKSCEDIIPLEDEQVVFKVLELPWIDPERRDQGLPQIQSNQRRG